LDAISSVACRTEQVLFVLAVLPGMRARVGALA
jgi:hypothetical protein